MEKAVAGISRDRNSWSWNRDNDNFEVLRRADILISDFSGVILIFLWFTISRSFYADTEFDKAV